MMAFTKETSIRTYYENVGEGEALVFVHGHGSKSQDWVYQSEFFREHFQVITYDVRGHGQTEKVKRAYSVPLFGKDLAELLNELGIEKAHIVGISMGGWIAFQFGVSYPEMTRSLTIVNSWADMRLKTLEDWRNYFQRVVIFRFLSMRKIGEVLSKRIFIKPEQESLRESFVESWSKNHKPSYMKSLHSGIGWTVHDKLSTLTMPILVVAADEDYTPLSMKEDYTRQLPNARLVVVEDSRHATPVEKPDEFNQVLLKFLQEVQGQ